MILTKKQTEEVLSNFLVKENGLNDVLQMVLNSLMLSERTVHLNEAEEKNKGNGYRMANVFGHGHQIELRVPRDRNSTFVPTILALFREQESYLKEVSFQMYSKGLTTRDIEDVMTTIYGSHYSKSKISQINVGFYEQMESWRNRKIDDHYLALYIDGIVVKLKRGSKYENECFYIIMGLKEDGTREIISIVNFPTESCTGWQEAFKSLKNRGLNSVGLIVSDGITGLGDVIVKIFPNTPHQKCIVHLHRNLQSRVRREDKREISSDLRKLLSPDDENNDWEKVEKGIGIMVKKWSSKYKTLSKYLSSLNWHPYFVYLDYDIRIRRMIYTTNWIERFNKSCRRTLKVRGAFPSEESVLALISSVAKDKGEKKYKYPIYLFQYEEKLMKKQ